MSGKAPPRAPRALLNSLAGSAVASSSATVPSASTSTRIGAAPPTGPRSLVNGNVPAGPSALRGGRGKPYVNGYGGIPTGPAAATPPTGPSPRYSQKGKQVETGWSQPGGQQGVNDHLLG
ncbi:hypothetical protein A0H81_03228 [Grifola frondosa]|uniref:Uncharacterized protein n=1 Tax=Grifola frondosa TaxID=5627 RepID=A0A1C7MIN0_GRIFR|nr:hypothetical protein A0H81_03228 [Grifola frondosa]